MTSERLVRRCAGWLLLIASAAAAEPLTIRVLARGAPVRTPRGTMRFEPVCDAPCSDGPLIASRPFVGGEALTIDVPADGSIRLLASAEGEWIPPVVAKGGDAVQIPSWPSATLAGRFDRAIGHVPEVLQIRVQPADDPRISATARCETKEDHWSCSIPSTAIDVRLSAEAFVPQYFWSLQAAPGETLTLVPLRLQRGPSVSGRIAARPNDLRETTVELKALAAAGRGAAGGPLKVKPNARGFFQIAGFAPGTYDLVATAPSTSPARASNLVMTEAKEYALDEPLKLAGLARLEVFVNPARAPDGPWRLQLDRFIPGSTFFSPVATVTLPDNGVWLRGQLPEGKYEISLKDASGSTLARRDVEIEAGMPPVMISTDLFEVAGEVTAGERPLPAKVELSWSDGSIVSFQADERGAFRGLLSHEGKWRVRVLPAGSRAKIYRPAIDIRRGSDGTARVRIRLPGGRIRGTVVDENGGPPAARAWVMVSGLRISNGDVDVDEDGSFEIVGLEPGDVTVEARSKEAESGAMPYVVDEHAQSPIRLVLQRHLKVRGFLTLASGEPLAGGIIRYFASTFREKRETFSGPGGEFALTLPKPTASVDIVALVAGFPVTITNVPVGTSPITVSIARDASTLQIALASTPPWPAIRRDGGGFISLRFLMLPPGMGEPPVRVEGEPQLVVEPGRYTLCPDPQPSQKCVTQVLTLGATGRFDARDFWPKREDSP